MAAAQTPPWTPDSWRTKPIRQCPEYPDQTALARAVADLERLPPLVHPKEITALRASLAEVARGATRSCCRAATAPSCSTTAGRTPFEAKIKLLLQMSLVLLCGRRQEGGAHRPHGRPVREAAVQPDRGRRRQDGCRRSGATSSTASGRTSESSTRPGSSGGFTFTPGWLCARAGRSAC